MLERKATSEVLLELFIRNQAALIKVDQEHSAGLQPSLVLDDCRIQREHADFAGHDDPVVVGQIVATGPQAVAIQHRANVLPIGKHDRSRAIPGLHDAGQIFVKRPLVRGHQLVLLPGLRNHHHDRLLERAAGHQQELQDVIESTRIRNIGLNHREDVLQGVTEQLALGDAFSCLHPIDIAAQRIDLTVV